jgi:hypothetical protein
MAANHLHLLFPRQIGTLVSEPRDVRHTGTPHARSTRLSPTVCPWQICAARDWVWGLAGQQEHGWLRELLAVVGCEAPRSAATRGRRTQWRKPPAISCSGVVGAGGMSGPWTRARRTPTTTETGRMRHRGHGPSHGTASRTMQKIGG